MLVLCLYFVLLLMLLSVHCAAAVSAVADVFFFFCLLLRLYFLLPHPCAILLLRFSMLVADGTLHSRWWWCVLGSLSLSLSACTIQNRKLFFSYTCTLTMGFADARSHTVALHIICSGRLAAVREIAISTLWKPLHSLCSHFFSSFRLAYLQTLTHNLTSEKTLRNVFFFALALSLDFDMIYLLLLICRLIWFRYILQSTLKHDFWQDCAWKGLID